MPQKKQKTQKAGILQKILLAYAVIISTVLLVLVVSFFRDYQAQQKIFAETDFKSLVKDAALQYSAEPVIQPVEKQVYFPSMRIKVPLTEDGEKLLYEYDPYTEAPAEDFLRVGSIMSKTVMYDLGKSLDQLPCQRLVRITFNQKEAINEDFTYETELRLKDGRMMYLYPNRAEKCMTLWTGLTPAEVVTLLKQTQSY